MDELILQTKIKLLNEILEIFHTFTNDNKNDYESFKLKLLDMYFKLNDKYQYNNYLNFKNKEQPTRHRCDHF